MGWAPEAVGTPAAVEPVWPPPAPHRMLSLHADPSRPLPQARSTCATAAASRRARLAGAPLFPASSRDPNPWRLLPPRPSQDSPPLTGHEPPCSRVHPSHRRARPGCRSCGPWGSGVTPDDPSHPAPPPLPGQHVPHVSPGTPGCLSVGETAACHRCSRGETPARGPQTDHAKDSCLCR